MKVAVRGKGSEAEGENIELAEHSDQLLITFPERKF